MVNASLLSERPRVGSLAWRSYCFFLSCKQTIYRKVVFGFPFLVSKKKSSGLINHYLLQSIALELTISDRFVKEKPRRLSLNRIVKE